MADYKTGEIFSLSVLQFFSLSSDGGKKLPPPLVSAAFYFRFADP
jgi:hypothetical protein